MTQTSLRVAARKKSQGLHATETSASEVTGFRSGTHRETHAASYQPSAPTLGEHSHARLLAVSGISMRAQDSVTARQRAKWA